MLLPLSSVKYITLRSDLPRDLFISSPRMSRLSVLLAILHQSILSFFSHPPVSNTAHRLRRFDINPDFRFLSNDCALQFMVEVCVLVLRFEFEFPRYYASPLRYSYSLRNGDSLLSIIFMKEGDVIGLCRLLLL